MKVSSVFLLWTFSFRFVKGVALLFGIKNESKPLFPYAQTRLVGDWHISYGKKSILEKIIVHNEWNIVFHFIFIWNQCELQKFLMLLFPKFVNKHKKCMLQCWGETKCKNAALETTVSLLREIITMTMYKRSVFITRYPT